MRVLLHIFFICLTHALWSQQNCLFGEIDTLTYGYRIGGSLDSIDLITGRNASTLTGGGWNVKSNIFENDYFFKNQGGQQYFSFIPWQKLKYSGLPHLGFAYYFGSSGTQFVRSEFEQVYRKKVMLNIFYEKNSANGLLRNSDYNHNNVQFQLNKSGKIFSFDLKSSFQSARVSQNGGLLIDTLPKLFDLKFLPVQKSNAETKTQLTRIELDNYFDFFKDSLKAAGIYTEHQLKIKKYKYEEENTISGIYSIINYDSIKTYDQHQWSEISNGVGMFFSGKRVLMKVQPVLSYWNFQNLGRFNDTLELNLKSNFSYFGKFYKLKESFNYNVIGAQNEWTNQFDFGIKKGNVRFTAKTVNSSLLPDYYQRYAQGNNYFSIGANFERQGRGNQDVSFGIEQKTFSILGKIGFTQLKNNYWFVDSIWRNDSLQKVSFSQIGISSTLNLGILNVHFVYNYTICPVNLTIIPVNQLFGRFYIKGKLFKAKKMIAYTGLDLTYLSSYQRLGYYSQIAAFDLNNLNVASASYSSLHFFAGFQIDEFKFFMRIENLNYSMSDKNLQHFKGYPIPSSQFRLGITWDFFN